MNRVNIFSHGLDKSFSLQSVLEDESGPNFAAGECRKVEAGHDTVVT